MVIGIIVPPSTLWKVSSSSSTQVIAGDVVQISHLTRFWFSQAKISQQPPEGEEQAEAIIYVENCASNKRLNETNFSSRPLPVKFPQGLYNLQQQYLLDRSDLVINVTTHATSDSDASAKVCKFSNADDYTELLDANTRAEVDEAEKKGFCQAIEPPSGTSPHTTSIQFNIHSHGYYYYALAVVPGELMNISYTYILSKHYFDKDELTPYNCSVVDQECVIDGLIKIASENCALAFIPTSSAVEPFAPYIFHLEQTSALGISIIFVCFFVVLTIFLGCISWPIICYVCNKKKSSGHAGQGVV